MKRAPLKSIELRELDAREPVALDRFYELYQAEFPDRNERESLENMTLYLRRKHRKRRQPKDDYHILVAHQGERLVGGSISDYLAGPSAGVIEFLFVGKDFRGRGLGSVLLAETERLLRRDASRIGRPLRGLVAEMNDPFVEPATRDNMNPFARSAVWGRWGFAKLDFPYVQPALDGSKSAVTNLTLIAKLVSGRKAKSVSPEWVSEVLAEYMRWAMRIRQPRRHPEFVEMRRHLLAESRVALVPLADYILRGNAPFHREEITSPHDRSVMAVASLLRSEIPKRHAIGVADLRRALAHERPHSRYHLWTIHEARGADVEGLASFFSLRSAGFGGYFVLSGSLCGRGLLRRVLTQVEQQLLEDSPRAMGLFVECFPASVPVFAHCGFRPIPVEYRVPALSRDPSTPRTESRDLTLLFRPFDPKRHEWSVTAAQLSQVFAEILARVYAVKQPRRDPCHRQFTATLRADERGKVHLLPWRPPG